MVSPCNQSLQLPMELLALLPILRHFLGRLGQVA